MNRHLIAVKVRVESCANQRVDLDGFSFHEYRLKRLDTETVKRWSTVQKHRMVFDDFFQNVPNHRVLPLDHLFRGFDSRAVTALLEPVVDERLEQLERHLLRQSALMQMKLGTDNDYRASRIVHALTKQILPEAALFAFQRIRQRFQWTVIRTAQNTPTAAVVE